MAEHFATELTAQQREVLNLIAQGDEVILNIAKQSVNELRWNGFIVRCREGGYELTSKGNAILGRKA